MNLNSFVEKASALERANLRLTQVDAGVVWVNELMEELLPKPPADDEPDDVFTEIQWASYGKAVARMKARGPLKIGDRLELMGLPTLVVPGEDFKIWAEPRLIASQQGEDAE